MRLRKGQMEMVGLVIIVILITLGILFMAQFALKDEPEKKIFTRKELAASTMSALMKTTVDGCIRGSDTEQYPQIGGDLLEDCAAWGDTHGDYTCEGKKSCTFLKEKVKALLDGTLGVWGKKYHLVFEMVGTAENKQIFDPMIQGDHGNCVSRERDTSGDFYLPTEGGLLRGVLYVCE